MIAHRAALFLAGAASLAAISTPASAQVADDVVLNIMRECARIDDPSARLACYDNNIRTAGANPRTIPGETVVQGSGAVMSGPNTTGRAGFGAEDIRGPERFELREGELQELTARVADVRQVGVGRYEITLEDGAVWRISDSVPQTYSVPRRGAEVEINRASLGSFLLRYRNQQSVRVERVD
ncbi:hypothetical protein [Alteraurantiacibacter aquimixticola]|uniref:Uncharacterized protein n=1 Tax=Alteraurantiacibacter aquimixticola TaxID=2489173 RepID=A0A4T3EZD1_9SPHN|nr:hypothetical protein [Alteraurantiacibacter aquimixticola]TIX50131.1 hypothetical protein E5222_07485 [Alteraurantiacibacter aquimixticola]